MWWRWARAWFKVAREGGAGKRVVALVAESAGEIEQLVGQARQGVAEKRALATDRIFYSTEALGARGKLAFVYPGSGTVYAGMGRELAAAFPEILRRQDGENERLRSQFAGGRLWEGKKEGGAELSVREGFCAGVIGGFCDGCAWGVWRETFGGDWV